MEPCARIAGKIRSAIFVLLLAFPICSFGQTDTSIISKLLKSGSQINQTNPDSAIVILRKALAMSQRIGYKDGIARSLLKLTSPYNSKGDYRMSLRLLKTAYPYCRAAGLEPELLMAGYYNCLALPYFYLGQTDSAILCFYNAIEKANQSKTDDPSLRSSIYSNMGTAWMQREQYDQAIYYLKKAEEVSINHKLYKSLPGIYATLGGCYSSKYADSSGRPYFLKALELGNTYNELGANQSAASNLGVSYMKSDPNKAIRYFKISLSISHKTNSSIANIEPYIGLGTAYHNLGKQDSARKYLEAATFIATKYNMPEEQVRSRYTLARVYMVQQAYEAASRQLIAVDGLRDSLARKERIDENNKMEVKFRTAEKDKEIAQKQLTITLQDNNLKEKNLWIAGISAAGVIVILLAGSIYRNSRQKQRLQKRQIQMMEQERKIGQLTAMMKGEEKERARLAMELHDGIGGMLAAIQMNFSSIESRNGAVCDMKDVKEIMKLVESTSGEVRKTAHNLMPDILLRYSFSDAIQMYCENISLEGPLNIELKMFGTPNFQNKSFSLMLYRIIQELIQNVIRHSGADHALVQLFYTTELLMIIVEDNGAGFDTTREYTGMGLPNLISRVQVLKGQLDLSSTSGKGTTITIKFDHEVLKYIMTHEDLHIYS